jgi:hypothetical protein
MGTIIFIGNSAHAQVINTGITDLYDSIENKKLSIGGYIDTYFGFDSNQPENSVRPYVVNNPRHNEVNINLAFIDLKYKTDKIRAHLVPGFGTYINTNYSTEKGSLKNLVEANVGICISHRNPISQSRDE